MEDEAASDEVSVRVREDESVGSVKRRRPCSGEYAVYRNYNTPWYSQRKQDELLTQLGMCQFHVQSLESRLEVGNEECNVLMGEIESLKFALAVSHSRQDTIQSQYDKVKNELDQLRKEATEWKQYWYTNTITKMKHESGSHNAANTTTGDVVQIGECTLTDNGTLTVINDLVEQLQSTLVISPTVPGAVMPESVNSYLNTRVTTDAEGGVTETTVAHGMAQSVMALEMVGPCKKTIVCTSSLENTKHPSDEKYCRMEDIIRELKQQLSLLRAQLQYQALTQHQLPALQKVGTLQKMASQEPQHDRTDVSQTQKVSDDANLLSTWEVL